MGSFLSSKNEHESFIHGMRVDNEKCSSQCLETLKNSMYEISEVTHPIRGDCESFLFIYKRQFKRSPNKNMKKELESRPTYIAWGHNHILHILN